jgi:hypothetical protein
MGFSRGAYTARALAAMLYRVFIIILFMLKDICLSSHFRSDCYLATTKSKFVSLGRRLKELTKILGKPLVDSSALSRVR